MEEHREPAYEMCASKTIMGVNHACACRGRPAQEWVTPFTILSIPKLKKQSALGLTNMKFQAILGTKKIF